MNVYKTNPKNYRTICSGDSDWYLRSDDLTLVARAGIEIRVARAGIEISPFCPDHVKLTIYRAIDEGHIKLVANIPEREYMWEKLQS